MKLRYPTGLYGVTFQNIVMMFLDSVTTVISSKQPLITQFPLASCHFLRLRTKH